MLVENLEYTLNKSCPARGTWIEISDELQHAQVLQVVPRKGHVD